MYTTYCARLIVEKEATQSTPKSAERAAQRLRTDVSELCCITIGIVVWSAFARTDSTGRTINCAGPNISSQTIQAMAKKITWAITPVRVGDLVEWDKNPRVLTEQAAKELDVSLTKFGYVEPAVVNADGRSLIGGHMRLRRMRQLGMLSDDDTVEVRMPSRQLTKSEYEELAIRLNKNTGDWDWNILGESFDDLKLVDYGFTVEELTMHGIELDEQPKALTTDGPSAREDDYEVPDDIKTKIKRGDIITIGAHRLLCGDSTSAGDVDKVMNKHKADIVFTDPPYGISVGAKNRMLNERVSGKRNGDDIKDDDLTPDALYAVLMPAFNNLARVADDRCAIYITTPTTYDVFPKLLADAGIPVRHTLIWVKDQATFSMGRLDYEYRHEAILFTWKKTHKRIRAGEMQTSVWEVPRPRGSKEHPTMKPVKLVENALLNSSEPGDIVLDIFLGSGTTMIAAHQLGRKCYGIEYEPKYCQVIINRMQALDPTVEVFINGKPVA